GDKGILVIPMSMILFSLGGSTFGMSEEVIPLFAVFISLMFSLGYDSMTAILILFLSTQAGYVGSTINPFNVLIAQGVAGVYGNPLLWFRMLSWIVITGISIVFTMLYASRVKKNPLSSIVYESDLKVKHKFQNFDTEKEFSTQDKLIIAGFIVGLGIMIWGIISKGWYMVEISALFLGLGLFAGGIARFSQKEIAEAFVEGCSDFAYAAVIIGLARGVLVILEGGMIIDTILNSLANLLGGLPKFLFTTILLISQVIVSFFVPSSSGAAALTMPVMAPLGDLMNVSRDVVVLSNQFGNGLMNIISPTSGVLLAGLAIAEINFSKWFKVGFKIFAILTLVSAVLLYIATLF
ncbi:TPA: YfcC family protein, partial [Enterococcus faecium]